MLVDGGLALADVDGPAVAEGDAAVDGALDGCAAMAETAGAELSMGITGAPVVTGVADGDETGSLVEPGLPDGADQGRTKSTVMRSARAPTETKTIMPQRLTRSLGGADV